MSDYIKNTINDIRSEVPLGKSIVFISGVFNIIHPGHSRLLKYASTQGDYVVVGVFSSDLDKTAIISESDRMEALNGLVWVDKVFILREMPTLFIEQFKPDVVVKGSEFKDRNNDEQDIVDFYGGKLLFSSGDSSFTTLDLIKTEVREVNFSIIEKQDEFLNRHSITKKNIIKTIESYEKLKVIVVGDTIVDEYVSCDAVGLSQEEPTIVVRPVTRNVFIGGAGIVSSHAKMMGAETVYFSVVGNDESGRNAISALEDYGIDVRITLDESRMTTYKKRYRASGKSLLRVNEYTQQPIDLSIQDKIYDEIKEEISNTDVLLFSDFNYGLLPQELVDRLTKLALDNEVMLVADSQSSSQMGDISRFKNMTLITPTEHEARVSTKDTGSGLVKLAEKLRELTNTPYVFITLANEGVLINTIDSNKEDHWITDRLPAMNTSAKDPAGAGDALMVVSSLTLALGRSIWESVYLGSIAAACQVSRVGNIPLSANELLTEINEL